MNYTPDKYQRLALRTWRAESSWTENVNHAVLGAAGELGELINRFKKVRYKPGHRLNETEDREELADLFYYVVMLSHLFGVTLDDLFDILDAKLSSGHGWVEPPAQPDSQPDSLPTPGPNLFNQLRG